MILGVLSTALERLRIGMGFRQPMLASCGLLRRDSITLGEDPTGAGTADSPSSHAGQGLVSDHNCCNLRACRRFRSRLHDPLVAAAQGETQLPNKCFLNADDAPESESAHSRLGELCQSDRCRLC